MFARRLLFAQLAVLALVHLTQRVGIYYFALNPNNNYFAITHMLGGIWAGLFAAWLYTVRGRKHSIIICILAALALGVVWEMFEVVADLNFFDSPGYIGDTLNDLMMDVIGGLIGGILASRIVSWNGILLR